MVIEKRYLLYCTVHYFTAACTVLYCTLQYSTVYMCELSIVQYFVYGGVQYRLLYACRVPFYQFSTET